MQVPIVMLHHVSDDKILDSLKPYSISRASFVQLLDCIEEGSLHTKRFGTDSIYQAGKNVFITFDDCPRHLWDFAIPELQRRGMKAVFFMPTAHISGYNSWDVREGRSKVELMTEEEIRQLSVLGMEVGSHGHRHVHLGKLKDENLISEELQLSKSILEEITGQSVVSLAYPFGSVPSGYKQLLRNAGYQFGLSIYQPWENRYALRRFIYHDGDTRKTLRQKLSFPYRIYRTLTDPLK